MEQCLALSSAQPGHPLMVVLFVVYPDNADFLVVSDKNFMFDGSWWCLYLVFHESVPSLCMSSYNGCAHIILGIGLCFDGCSGYSL